jgi:hypothetical protein
VRDRGLNVRLAVWLSRTSALLQSGGDFPDVDVSPKLMITAFGAGVQGVL